MHPVSTTSHNGITTHSLGREGLTTGTLTFGVGMGDEPPTLAGVTHLLEHLLLRTVQPVPEIHGGTVKADSVEFFASGTADAVANFLNKVGRAISAIDAITDEDLRLEKQIIDTEHELGFHNVSAGMLTHRFGLRGLGTSAFGAPTTHALTAAEVATWARRWLVQENAALTFTGDVPSTLNVELPSGPRPTHQSAPPSSDTPRLVESNKAGIALSLIVPLEQKDVLGAALHNELFTRLRHKDGLIYTIEVHSTRVDNGQVQLNLVLDPTNPNLMNSLRGAIGAIRDISTVGFSNAAIESARATVATTIEWDQAGGAEYLDAVAIDGIRGRSIVTPTEALNVCNALNSADLTEVLTASTPTLIVAVHRGADLTPRLARELGLPLDTQNIWVRHTSSRDRTRHKTMRGKHPRWRAKSSNERLWVSDSHVLHRAGKTLTSIALADLALVGDRECGCVALVDKLGRNAEIDITEWKAGKGLRRRLLKAVPREVVRAFPGDLDT